MTLAHDKRPVFVTAALLCYAAAIVLAPAGARSQLEARTRAADITPTHSEPVPSAIAPKRDAFAPRATIEDDPPAILPTPPPQLPRLPAPRAVPMSIAPVASHVTAIVTGTRPTAIVDSADGSRLVSIGDALDGSTIAGIAGDAVVLANGKRLTLDPAAAP